MPEGFFGYTDALKPDNYDPDAARKLLAEAGWPDGFGLTLHGPNDRYVNDEKVAQAIAQMLQRIGIVAKVETMPRSVSASACGARHERAPGGLHVGHRRGGGVVAQPRLDLQRREGRGMANRGRYSNPRFDDMIDEALTVIDEEKREDMIQKATNFVMADTPLIPLYLQIPSWATRANLRYAARADGYMLAHESSRPLRREGRGRWTGVGTCLVFHSRSALQALATTGEPPYIHVRMVDGVPRMSGLAHYAIGEKIPRRDGSVDGVFAEWRWDGRTLSVANCRYGLRPIFYFVRPGEICVSTSIEKLLALGASPELDQEALAVFFRLNWFLAEDTPFKSIRLVPPAAQFTWDGSLRLASKLHIVRPNGLARDAAIDGLVETFRQAVERRYVDGAIVPLSGGRDSRHTLYELCRIGRPRLCVTARDIPPYPNPNENTLYAALLARTFSIEHAVVEYIADIVQAEHRKNALANFCTLEHAWYMQVHDRLDGESRRIFDGLGGDYLAAGGGLDPTSVELLERSGSTIWRGICWCDAMWQASTSWPTRPRFRSRRPMRASAASWSGISRRRIRSARSSSGTACAAALAHRPSASWPDTTWRRRSSTMTFSIC